jgi:FkbM family methyltransferase
MSRERAQYVLTQHFGAFGPLNFPYVKMGNIDSLHLFGGETELMIFALYLHWKDRVKRALDIGANLGLHSICMAKLGWQVRAFEPDFSHFDHLLKNLLNNFVDVEANMAAVHTENGEARFVRVLNNLTGNHLEGYKDSYGPRESVIVPTVDCRPLFDWAQFAKIDCEGNEGAILGTTTAAQWKNLHAVVEVRSEAVGLEIYRHMMGLEVPMWSQKDEWARVRSISSMPRNNREGSLFIGHRPPWD